MKRDVTRSLSFVVSVWIALTIAAGMAFYALFEYASMPRVTAAEIALEHLWHVLVLGLVTYALCLVLLRHFVVRPLEALRFHLRRVSLGEVDELVIDTRVSEVRSIVDGINGMIHRMQSARQRGSEEEQQRLNAIDQLVADAQRQVLAIERLSEQLDAEQDRMAVSIRESLSGLDEILAEMLQGGASPAVAADPRRATADSVPCFGQARRRENVTRSLSVVIAVWTALAISVSMGLYAIVEYLYMPGVTFPQLLMHHLLHVLALGVAVYIVSLWVLHHILVRPLQAIRLHLLRVGIGRLEHLVIDTAVSELCSVVDDVNDMIERMRIVDGVSTEQVRGRVERTKRLVMQAQRKADEIARISKQLDTEDHPFGRSIQGRLGELHKTLVWVFLKA